jgi:hypothetical protein
VYSLEAEPPDVPGVPGVLGSQAVMPIAATTARPRLVNLINKFFFIFDPLSFLGKMHSFKCGTLNLFVFRTQSLTH